MNTDKEHIEDVVAARSLHWDIRGIQAIELETITKEGGRAFKECYRALTEALEALEYLINE